jgi:hypothetical protein
MKKQSYLILTILIGGIVLLASFTSRVWMASGAKSPATSPQTSPAMAFVPSNPPRQDSKILGLLRRNALMSHLHGPLQAMGNRLEVKGRERAMITGTLRSEGSSQEQAFTLIAELPNRLRLTLSSASGNRVLIVDGQEIRSSSSLNERDYDLLETLLYDTAEHLLLEQVNGSVAMRFLGGRFHDEGNPTGTAYHIFEASEEIALGDSSRQQTKYFSFNSDNWLLERVTYPRTINNVEIKVEVRLSDWEKVDGQTIARTIERFDNKASRFRLTINAISFAPAANDGIFQ